MSGLLLITIDRLPAWILPAYGATWVSTPALDGLAAAGVVLDRLVATSLDPVLLLDETVGPLLADASAAGQAPAFVTDDAAEAARRGGAFDTVVVPVPGAKRRARDVRRTALGGLFAATHDAIRAGRGPVWVHATSLGKVWDAPEEFDEPYVDPEDPPPPAGTEVPSLRVDRDTDPDLVVGWRQRMAGQVSLLDRLVGGLVASLPDRRHDPWCVCVVGIRGMALGIHGLLGNPPAPADELPFGESIHLPAILVDRAGRMAGQRHPGILIPADVGATLRDLVGVPPRTDGVTGGRSLESLLGSWADPSRERGVCVARGGIAVVTRDWHLIECDAPDGIDPERRRMRLYAKPDDFFELCDVADRSPDAVAELAAAAAAARVGRIAAGGEDAGS